MDDTIDSPLDPRDAVLRRLAKLGVPEDYIGMLYPGVVAFVAEDESRVKELVSAIMPPEKEVVEAVQDNSNGGSDNNEKVVKSRFKECISWLEWIMFRGDPSISLSNLSRIGDGYGGVCGAVWGSNDIAYRCHTCELDSTCAICVPCFNNGNHVNHDYSIIYTGGGCCDCGDATAWRREGFCSRHKGAELIVPLPDEYARLVGPVLDAVLGFWNIKLVNAESASQEHVTASECAVKRKYADELTFAIIEMLFTFCDCSDSFLSFLSKRVILLDGLLEILVRAEKFLNGVAVTKLHELLLKLLGEPIFKYEFAKVFLGYYSQVVREAIKEGGDSTFEKHPLVSSFSVQIFTVPTLIPRLVKEINLLTILLECLGCLFVHCAGDDGRLLVAKTGRLFETTRRVVDDIKFVMSHGAVVDYVMHEQRDILQTWMKLLSFLQGMDALKRETGLHVDDDNDFINVPFVLAHSVAVINSLLVDGAFSSSNKKGDKTNLHEQDRDEGDNIRHTKVGRVSQESSACNTVGRSVTYSSGWNDAGGKSYSSYQSLIPSSVSWLINECLRAIENSFGVDTEFGDSVSSNISNNSSGNFLALRRTLSKFRKGRSIFGLSRSSDNHSGQRSSPPRYSSLSMDVDMENVESVCQDHRTFSSGEADSLGCEDNMAEGDRSAGADNLRVLNSSDWKHITYDVSSQDVSIHIPLHRLLSMLLQKALARCCVDPWSPYMTSDSVPNLLSAIFSDCFGYFLRGCHPCGFSASVMEHPLRNRVFCAQVQAGMWRKNGDAAIFSCDWYRSVHWYEQGLELDLFLLQCCAALAPPDLYVNRVVERFGLSDYLSLNLERSNKYESVLVLEMLKLIIQIVQERRFSGLTPAENLRRELVRKLAVGDATRSQLVKSLPRDLLKFDQLQEILDMVAVYSNPSGLSQGKYSLRGPYWKELDLYHPRMGLRDFQVAEERYLYHCHNSALTTQLPTYRKIYPPLKCVAKIATCRIASQFIRAVLFHAVFCDKTSESHASDNILLTALHLLSLALDICLEMRESWDASLHTGDSPPLLAFAGEDIGEASKYGVSEQSLLSLLVLLMRFHKKYSDVFLAEGSCNISSLIEGLLKKFAELDSECMRKLQKLAPELGLLHSQVNPGGDVNMEDPASDSQKRKAKARERQAAIMEKMKAEQSRFLSSIDSNSEDDQEHMLEERTSDGCLDKEEVTQDVCSLCHDPNSKTPVSFLVLLQKSRLLSNVDRIVPSWDQAQPSEEGQVLLGTEKVNDGPAISSSSRGSWEFSSTQLMQFIQNTVNEFGKYAQPAEVNAVIEFMKARFPSSCYSEVSCPAINLKERTLYTFEMFEQELYSSVQKEMHDSLLLSTSVAENGTFSATEDGMNGRRATEYALLGKYLASLSIEMAEQPLGFENADSDRAVESSSHVSQLNGFGPMDCDGVYLSSCGHPVHQECLSRYLTLIRERVAERLVFQGEFLCPLCRQLANSVLPSFPGVSDRHQKQPIIFKVSSSDAAQPFTSSAKESNSLWVPQALRLLQSCAKMVENGILKISPLQSNEVIEPNFDIVSRMLFRMYFPDRQEKFSESSRVNLSMIMWDTLKYSLVSMEVGARSESTTMNTTNGLTALHKEFKSSTGFILTLLMKTLQRLKSKNSIHVLQRLRGVQLFAISICSGVSMDYANCSDGGIISGFLRNVDKDLSYPDTKFWDRTADPVLAHDAFSSLMWVIFCLPCSFLTSEESLLSLIHLFYIVSVTQAIITYCGKHPLGNGDSDFLIMDICNILRESGWIHQYFASNYVSASSDIRDVIHRLSLPYLRRCALLWDLLTSTASSPFSDRDVTFDASSHANDNMVEHLDGNLVGLSEVEELKNMFKIPTLDVVLKDQTVRSLVKRWLQHFSKMYEGRSFTSVLHSTPVVPFKLMRLPHVYQDLLQRYIKKNCPECKKVIFDPALCLVCGKLCCPIWKTCCRESGCVIHAMTCGASAGVFLLIKRTTILLLRSGRQASWPSPYLDAFGEEDVEMHRGKPLYLNEERYAALASMVASHNADRTSVLHQTTFGTLLN